jgi:hypothetical protein
MKYLKETLTFVLVLVNAFCFTGCGISDEEKRAANAEFSQWFSHVESIEPMSDETLECIRLYVELTSYGKQYVSEFVSAKIIIGNKDYEHADLALFLNDANLDPITYSAFGLQFDGINEPVYDSMTIIIKEDNAEEITLTYYPNIDEEKRAANTIFSQWYAIDSIEQEEIGGGITVTIKSSSNYDYPSLALWFINKATIKIGNSEYWFSEMRFSGTDGAANEIRAHIKFDEVTTKDFDSFSITIADPEVDEVNLTFYPKVV